MSRRSGFHNKAGWIFSSGPRAGDIFVEVKNCSLARDGVALFPDAVTARGTRHLLELEKLMAEGQRAALIFCVQRADAERFRPAAAIDPVYAETLARVHGRGLTVLAYQAEVRPGTVRIARKIPVEYRVAQQMNRELDNG